MTDRRTRAPLPQAIYLAPPYQPPKLLEHFAVPPMPPPAVRVDLLLDHASVEEKVFTAIRQAEELNLRLDAVMLNPAEYFTFRESMRDKLRGVVKGREVDGGLVFNGVRVLLDPMRDDGELVPVFDEDSAVAYYTMRRAQEQRT